MTHLRTTNQCGGIATPNGVRSMDFGRQTLVQIDLFQQASPENKLRVTYTDENEEFSGNCQNQKTYYVVLRDLQGFNVELQKHIPNQEKRARVLGRSADIFISSPGVLYGIASLKHDKSNKIDHIPQSIAAMIVLGGEYYVHLENEQGDLFVHLNKHIGRVYNQGKKTESTNVVRGYHTTINMKTPV